LTAGKTAVGEQIVRYIFARESTGSNATHGENLVLLNRSILAVCFLWWPVVAYGCACDKPSHSRDFRKAKAIFIGQVIEISSNEREANSECLLPYKIKLRVEKKWKGGVSAEVMIKTDNGESACKGFPFRKDERYLIYASQRSGSSKELIAFTWCTRSRPMSQEDESTEKEMKELNSFWFRLKARLWPF
jgi:hypothetical protein